MAAIKSYRNEHKFFINYYQYIEFKQRLIHFMNKDPHGDSENRYHIRSLYFDDIYNSAYYEKVNGVEKRKKYRLRVYNHSDDVIKFEKKGKSGQYTLKESELVTRAVCDSILCGNIDFLGNFNSVLLSDLYIQMKTLFLKPVVIVDYIREAYTSPIENVRVTFDMNLKSGLYSTDLWNRLTPSVEVLENKCIIMEVKFNKFLPAIFRELLLDLSSERRSISKYILCRDFAERCIRGECNG